MLTIIEIKQYLNIDYDDIDYQIQEYINESVMIIETSTGADLDIIKKINDIKLNQLYKTVQKLVIREEFEEKTADSKALTAKYNKLKAYYRKVVKENGY